ncbi:MAG: hypothetical protein JXR76_18325 [Deltaproteobacteria bacterium]|nr:hypothetical protein [Deltaproteobacteria bacterium]
MTRNTPQTRVNSNKGKYHFDCSGMAVWVLKRSAPAALLSPGRPNERRPLAVDFFNGINRIPKGKTRGHGTAFPRQRTYSQATLSPGSGPNGSHRPVPDMWLLRWGPKNGMKPKSPERVADAGKFKHEHDSRNKTATGFGTGVLVIATNRSGHPIGLWMDRQPDPKGLGDSSGTGHRKSASLNSK